MDYKNDNRTPRDRITGEFLSELLFTDIGGCDCEYTTGANQSSSCDNNSSVRQQSGTRSRTASTPVVRNCGCARRDGRQNTDRGGGDVGFTGNYSLAMAYVPMQEFEDLFDMEEGFCEGTIFKKLRFPFYPTSCGKDVN